MTKEEAIAQLRGMAPTAQRKRDPESDHPAADKILLELIDDKRVTKAYNAILKWYA